MTYSIIGRDRTTGEIGCAVQSKFPGVGSIVLHGRVFAEGAGCLTTQAFSNPRHGIDGLKLMARGATPAETLTILTRGDAVVGERQIAAMTLEATPAAFTGETVTSWEGAAGSAIGENSVATGNALASQHVLPAMIAAFEDGQGEITERLIAALRAGRDAGGELRGLQSAAVLVLKAGGGYGGAGSAHVDISVYDHAQPIEELARCYRLHRLSYFPSREEDLIPIEGDLVRELKAVLQARGYEDLSAGEAWRDADIAALKRFMGMENYDNRLRDDAMIDREVLEDIRAKRV